MNAALQQLVAAPHRLMFFIGASNVLAAMLWWTAWLSGHVAAVVPGLPGPWLHGFLMQYQVLPSFIFGFLLTVFPRWLNLPAATRWHYLPVGLGLFSGQVLVLVAAATGSLLALHLGWVNTLAGWLAGMALLAQALWAARSRDWHAWSSLLALGVGLAGLLAFGAWLHSGDLAALMVMLKLGAVGLLLPIYLTVAHRLFPFFAGNVVAGYVIYRPRWALGLLWLGVFGHLAAELLQIPEWRWPADALIAALSAWLLWQWKVPRTAPALLRVLFIGFAWLPLAMGLYAVDSLLPVLGVTSGFGKAPLHALAIGFFGSLLVAMVTRVTAGHSGRPLQLDRSAAFAFAGMHAVALLRIAADLTTDPWPLWRIAALAWLCVFLPWVLRALGIYLRPRADGKPG